MLTVLIVIKNRTDLDFGLDHINFYDYQLFVFLIDYEHFKYLEWEHIFAMVDSFTIY